MYHGTFETLSLFILRETTPEILGHWEELEFTAMGTILLIVFKFSTSSTTNSFSVFPTALKVSMAISSSFVYFHHHHHHHIRFVVNLQLNVPDKISPIELN